MSTFGAWCQSRTHCSLCRERSGGGSRFRQSLYGTRAVEAPEFDCPHGVPWDCGAKRLCPQPVALTVSVTRPALLGLGDVLEMLLARLGLRGWLLTKLGSGCGCETRKAWLNRYVPMGRVRIAAAAVLAVGLAGAWW